MTENRNVKRRKITWKVALIAAVCVAALTVTAFAAVPAVQQFFTTYTITYHSGDNMESAIVVPPMSLTEQGGRTVLTVDDKEIDVTDSFAKDGKYVFEQDGSTITVYADGEVDIMTADSDPMSFGFNLYDKTHASVTVPQDPQVDAAPAGEAELPHPHADQVQEPYTVLPAPDGGMNISDSQGNLVAYDPPLAKDAPAR